MHVGVVVAAIVDLGGETDNSVFVEVALYGFAQLSHQDIDADVQLSLLEQVGLDVRLQQIAEAFLVVTGQKHLNFRLVGQDFQRISALLID